MGTGGFCRGERTVRPAITKFSCDTACPAYPGIASRHANPVPHMIRDDEVGSSARKRDLRGFATGPQQTLGPVALLHVVWTSSFAPSRRLWRTRNGLFTGAADRSHRLVPNPDEPQQDSRCRSTRSLRSCCCPRRSPTPRPKTCSNPPSRRTRTRPVLRCKGVGWRSVNRSNSHRRFRDRGSPPVQSKRLLPKPHLDPLWSTRAG